jgi:hypothetical protein
VLHVTSVFISRRRNQVHEEVVLASTDGLYIRAGSEAGVGGPHLHART